MFITGRVLATNKKTKETYKIVGMVKNTTNDMNGQIMIMYQHQTEDATLHFVREYSEFRAKFDMDPTNAKMLNSLKLTIPITRKS